MLLVILVVVEFLHVDNLKNSLQKNDDILKKTNKFLKIQKMLVCKKLLTYIGT